MAQDAWGDAMGWTALALASVSALLSSVCGYRVARWLLFGPGFLLAAVPTHALLYVYMDRTSLNAHDIIFVALSLGVASGLAAIMLWRYTLMLFALTLGVSSAIFLLAFPKVTEADYVLNVETVYCAVAGVALLACIMQFFFPRFMIILSTSACGAITLALAFDSQVQTGLAKRFFRVVAEALQSDQLFAVTIKNDDFGDAPVEEELFLVLSTVLLAAVMCFLQAFVTSRHFMLKPAARYSEDVLFEDESDALLAGPPHKRTVNLVPEDDCDDDPFRTHR